MLPRIAGVYGDSITTETNSTVPAGGNGYAQNLASYIQKQFASPKNGSPKNKKMKGLVDESCSKRIETDVTDVIVISNARNIFNVDERSAVQCKKVVENTNDQYERDALQRLVALSSGVTFDSNINESNCNSPRHSPVVSKSSPDGSGGCSPVVSLMSIYDAYLEKKKSTPATPGLTESLLRSFPSSSSNGQNHGTLSGKKKYRNDDGHHKMELFVSGRMSGGSKEDGCDIGIRQSRKSSTTPNAPNSPMVVEPPTNTISSSSSSSSSSRLNPSYQPSDSQHNQHHVHHVISPSTTPVKMLSTGTRNSQKQSLLGVGKSLLNIDPDSMEDELSIQVINSTPRKLSQQQPSPTKPQQPKSASASPSPPRQQQPSPYHHSNQGMLPKQPPSLSPSIRAHFDSLDVSYNGTVSGLDVDELDRKQLNRDVEVGINKPSQRSSPP